MTTFAVGTDFGGYRIEGVAGRGGMGVVYRARQLRPERVVALKVIAPELSEDAGFRDRFDRESEIAATIEHPNVIPVYEVNERDGLLYIVMRYVEDGTDLRALIGEGLPPPRAARIIAQVASALDAAHARGLVHRDIKPGNVLIARTGKEDHAYLTDFGLAKYAAEGGPTETGQWVGTVDYVAPEQIEGRRLDGRADVYALSCLLYQALSGQIPYPRDSDVAKIFAHLTEEPPSVADSVAGLPSQFDEVLRRGMARDPNDRFPSAGDLGRAALAAAHGEQAQSPERSVAAGEAAPAHGSEGATEGAATPVEDAETVGASAVDTRTGRGTAPASARARPDAGRRRIALAGGVALIVAVAAGAALALGGGGGGGGEDEQPGKVVGQPIPVGQGPTAIATGAGSVWVANLKSNDVSRIDLDSGKTVGKRIRSGREPYGVAVGAGAVWVANLKANSVTRLDPRTGRAAGRPIRVARGPADIAVGGGSVWTANYDSDTVSRVDPRSNRTVGPPIEVGDGPADVAVGEGSVWVANVEDDTLTRISPGSGKVLGPAIPVGQSPESVAVGANSVWVGNIKADQVTRVDPQTNQVSGAPIKVGERPDDVAVGEGAVWVSNLDSNTVTRIDPERGSVVGDPIPVGDGPGPLAVGGGKIWVGDFRADTVERIEP